MLDNGGFFRLAMKNAVIGFSVGLVLFSLAVVSGLLVAWWTGGDETLVLCEFSGLADLKTMLVLMLALLIVSPLSVAGSPKTRWGNWWNTIWRSVGDNLLGAILFVIGAVVALLTVLLCTLILRNETFAPGAYVSSLVVLALIAFLLWGYCAHILPQVAVETGHRKKGLVTGLLVIAFIAGILFLQASISMQPLCPSNTQESAISG